jgi:hypothetical protein
VLLLLVACARPSSTPTEVKSLDTAQTNEPTTAATSAPTSTTTPPLGMAQITPLQSPLQSKIQANESWITYTHSSGITVAYPGSWSARELPDPWVILHVGFVPPNDVDGIRPVTLTAKRQPGVESRRVGQRGVQGLDYFVRWEGSSESNNLHWYWTIAGSSGASGPWDGLEELGLRGSLTQGYLDAMAYDEKKGIVVHLLVELDRDSLIEIDKRGFDEVVKERFAIFRKMVDSVTVRP